jgi:hypothetical protein
MIFRASSAVGEPVVLRKVRIKAGGGTIQAKKKEVMRAVTLIAAALSLATTPIAAQDNDETIKRAVRTCVDLVHRLPVGDPLFAQFYKEFDAYYNPATKQVFNNGWRAGDRPVQYEFNKCMVGQGYPLGAGGWRWHDEPSEALRLATVQSEVDARNLVWQKRFMEELLNRYFERMDRIEAKQDRLGYVMLAVIVLQSLSTAGQFMVAYLQYQAFLPSLAHWDCHCHSSRCDSRGLADRPLLRGPEIAGAA